jgi:hypothetical protein
MYSGKPSYTAEELSARSDESPRFDTSRTYSDDLVRSQELLRCRLPGSSTADRCQVLVGRRFAAHLQAARSRPGAGSLDDLADPSPARVRVRWRQGDAETRHSKPQQDLAWSEQLHDLGGAEQLELR